MLDTGLRWLNFNAVLHSEEHNIVPTISVPFQFKEKQVLLIQLNAYSQHNTNLLIVSIIWLHASVSMQDTRLTFVREQRTLHDPLHWHKHVIFCTTFAIGGWGREFWRHISCNYFCNYLEYQQILYILQRVPKKCIHISNTTSKWSCAPRTTTVLPPFSLTVLPVAWWR